MHCADMGENNPWRGGWRLPRLKLLFAVLQGTSAEQDNRFSNKQKKLLKQLKFAECLEKKVSGMGKRGTTHQCKGIFSGFTQQSSVRNGFSKTILEDIWNVLLSICCSSDITLISHQWSGWCTEHQQQAVCVTYGFTRSQLCCKYWLIWNSKHLEMQPPKLLESHRHGRCWTRIKTCCIIQFISFIIYLEWPINVSLWLSPPPLLLLVLYWSLLEICYVLTSVTISRF